MCRKKKNKSMGRKKKNKSSRDRDAVFVAEGLVEQKQSKFRSKIAQPRKEGVSRVTGKDPSRGGSEGYHLHQRLMLINLYQSGHTIPASNLRSVQRWLKDGVVPKKKTGNKANSVIRGEHLMLLAIFKRIYPQATNSQCAVFICLHSSDGRVLTNNEVSDGMRKLNMTRKKSSTTAYRAFTPRNVFLHECFWTFDFPGGIKNVPRRILCDADEMSFDIGEANESYGHGVKGCRIRKAGNYGRGKKKVTVMMIIEPGNPDLDETVDGSIERPRIWYRASFDKGTSTEGYRKFLKRDFLKKLKADELRRTLLHDNLTSHKSDEIYDLMDQAGHDVICRPPYRPNEAPIEWAFDQLACEIRRRWMKIDDEKDLIKEIRTVIETRAGLGGFDKLFRRCGYKYDGEVVEQEEG